MRCALRFPPALLPAILFRVPPRISTAAAAGRPLHSRLGAPPRATATTAAVAAAAASELPLSPYWRSRLEALTRPAALSLVSALSPNNPLLFENRAGNREGTLVAFAVAEKEVHADKVLLIRCGDFYEAYGLDALLLVEHAGLNPMAGRARAGCPVANLQATADCLTSAGLTVAVYEEVEPARQATADRQRGAAAVRRRAGHARGRSETERTATLERAEPPQ